MVIRTTQNMFTVNNDKTNYFGEHEPPVLAGEHSTNLHSTNEVFCGLFTSVTRGCVVHLYISYDGLYGAYTFVMRGCMVHL